MAEIRFITYHSLNLGQWRQMSRHAVPEVTYREQINVIRRRHRLLSPEELAEIRTHEDLQYLARSSSHDIYIPTYDDGYAEHPRAAEILAEAGGAGIFFITSETTRGQILLANKLHLLDLYLGGLGPTIAAIEEKAGQPLQKQIIDAGRALLGRVQKADFDTREERAIKVGLQELGHVDPLSSAIDSAIESLLPIGVTDGLYADYTGLKYIVACGSLIGGHGRSHRRLPLLDDESKLLEVNESAAFVRQFHKNGPLHFAHPYGTYDNDTILMLAGAGFQFLHTIVNGALGPDEINHLCLPRIDVKQLREIL